LYPLEHALVESFVGGSNDDDDDDDMMTGMDSLTGRITAVVGFNDGGYLEVTMNS